MITMDQVLEQIVELLKNSSDIQTFCQNRYSQKPTIFSGVNFQDPPSDEDLPCISIHTYDHSGLSRSQMEESYDFEITVSVLNEEKNIEDVSAYKLIEYFGEKEAREFIYLIQRDLAKMPCPFNFFFQDIQFSGSILYPVFEASMSMKVTIQKSLGGIEPQL